MDKSKDHLERRCPRLGGPVTFGYCRTGDEAGPCWKIIDCWWEAFDILTYLKANYSKETVETLCKAKPEPKVSHLVALIEQAKQRLDKK